MGHNRWFTPTHLIESIRTFYGGTIDLDPTSEPLAQQAVQARRYYTKEDNGLMLPWTGRVYCNPPYAKTERGASQLEAFVEKADREYRLGNASEILLLIPVNSATKWWNVLSPYLMCMPDKRLIFRTEQGTRDSAQFPNALFYFGTRRGAFMEHFHTYGPIWHCVKYGTNYEEPVLDLWSQPPQEQERTHA